MYQLSTYVRNIAVFIIFMSFVTIIIPQNKYEKYVKLIIGIVMVGIIASPLVRLIGGFADGAAGFAPIPAIDMAAIEADIENASAAQIDNILAAYKTELAAHLERLVNTTSDFTFIEARFDINRDAERFGEIMSIFLTISETPADTRQRLISIDPVRIDIAVNTRGMPAPPADIDENPQIAALKNTIVDFYNMDIQNIHVFIAD
ncbi:MAG: stage III sporulation protein AF [Defluviitaleaceae bacterium]|nr:stage III sporulation protein AF [Defluviitaleaceae bacterium]